MAPESNWVGKKIIRTPLNITQSMKMSPTYRTPRQNGHTSLASGKESFSLATSSNITFQTLYFGPFGKSVGWSLSQF